MPDPFPAHVGGILSADIAVPQHERVVRFYAHVLGTGQNPLWREDLMNNRGMPIIGLGASSPEYAELPLQWMPHVQVADVARSVERALELGGSEVLHGKGDDGASLWAVPLDPDGAAFGLIPVVSEHEVPAPGGDDAGNAAGRIGRIAWIDLTVPDAAAARDFYREVVGWSVQDVAAEDASGRAAAYRMLGEGGTPAAGIRGSGSAGAGLPPVWMLHLPVGDLAESLRRVQAGGGKVLERPTGSGGDSTRAVVQDPVGACLALVPG